MYSVRYYPRFHVTAVGLGTYYPWILEHYCTCQETRMEGKQRVWLQNDAAAVVSEGIDEPPTKLRLVSPLNSNVERVAAVRRPSAVCSFSESCHSLTQ
jgi:hypothetical protein